jgi:aspartyl-tRNA(Asn)/glutamyl-tRNA(Gln) amidotransferase subunit B
MKKIGITRIHMEEDAGKLIHAESVTEDSSFVDLNRTGVPLIEIVSEPDLETPEEATAYLRVLRDILLYLGICDCNMEEGSFRCDANVSIRPVGETKLGTKAELKNMNSFKFIRDALAYEIERQKESLEDGIAIVQETRLFDPAKGETRSMRSKEEAHDYRYFPEPDLLPLVVDPREVEQIRSTLPELPAEKRERFIKDYDIPPYDAAVLTASRQLADFYEQTLKLYNDPKTVSNWVMGEVLRLLKEHSKEIADCPVTPKNLAGLLEAVKAGRISSKMAKGVFEEMFTSGSDADTVIEAQGLKQISDTGELTKVIEEVLAANPENVERYRAGKDKLFGFFVGQVMKATKGQANPELVSKILKEKLS